MISNDNPQTGKPLVFAHIGDLHITKAKEQNYIDLLSIVSQIEIQCGGKPDFVFLPGDNADNGRPAQYKLVATSLKMLSMPVHIITGDHDMEQGSLEDFYTVLAADPLPKSLTIRGIRCLFLDVSGPGKGGPDFRMGKDQLLWLTNELASAKAANKETVIFMHTYPDDLKNKEETAALNKLIAENDIVLFDMGHTHYNELANDGHTIFSATRSTGQIEEGPVGYSLVTVDNGIVSWRFKPLHDAFPFVVITAPADYRLIRKEEQIVSGSVEVHAVVFGAGNIQSVTCQVEDDAWVPMTQSQDERTWFVTLVIPFLQLITLTVEAIDDSGRPGRHTIKLATPLHKTVITAKNGSDAASIGAWPENGIFGTQLGPNRNGKPS